MVAGSESCNSCRDVHSAIQGLQSFMNDWFQMFHETSQRQTHFLEVLVDLFQNQLHVGPNPDRAGITKTLAGRAPVFDRVDVGVTNGTVSPQLFPSVSAKNLLVSFPPPVPTHPSESAGFSRAKTADGFDVLLEDANESQAALERSSFTLPEEVIHVPEQTCEAEKMLGRDDHVTCESNDDSGSETVQKMGDGKFYTVRDEGLSEDSQLECMIPDGGIEKISISGPVGVAENAASKSPSIHAHLFPPPPPKSRRQDPLQFPTRFVPLDSVLIYHCGKSVTYIIDNYVYFVNKRFKNRDDLYLRCREAKRQCSASCLLTPDSCKLMGAPHCHDPPNEIERYKEEARLMMKLSGTRCVFAADRLFTEGKHANKKSQKHVISEFVLEEKKTSSTKTAKAERPHSAKIPSSIPPSLSGTALVLDETAAEYNSDASTSASSAKNMPSERKKRRISKPSRVRRVAAASETTTADYAEFGQFSSSPPPSVAELFKAHLPDGDGESIFSDLSPEDGLAIATVSEDARKQIEGLVAELS